MRTGWTELVLGEAQSFLNEQVVGELATNNSSKCTQALCGTGRNVLRWNAAVIMLQLFANKTQSLGNTGLCVCVCVLREGPSNSKQVCLLHRPQVKASAPRTGANPVEITVLWKCLTCHFTKEWKPGRGKLN